MPGPMTGSQQKLALKKAAVWGTAVVCGANNGLMFLSGQAKRDDSVEADESRGRAFSIDGTRGAIAAPGTYTFYLRYAGAELPAAMLMGTAGAPVQQAATIAYLHSLTWNTDPYGLFLTIAKTMIAYIEEIPTAKVAAITISGEVGAKPLQVSMEVIGINKVVASAINDLTTFNNVTFPTDATTNPVMFSHLAFRMNAAGGAALGAGDVIYPGKFSLSIKRSLKGEYTGEYRTDAASIQDLIDEPSNAGFPEIKLTLEFPKHTATTYLAALGADTRYKADITATGAVIAGAYNYKHLWELPHLQLVNANPTDDNGRIKEPLEFIVHGATAAPTGMAVTDPLKWSITSKLATNPLA